MNSSVGPSVLPHHEQAGSATPSGEGWFRRRPAYVRAWQWTQAQAEAHLFDDAPLPEGVHFSGATYHRARREISRARFIVVTAHKQAVALEDGDWITPEPDGRGYYPIKPDIFATTYEPAESPPSEGVASPRSGTGEGEADRTQEAQP